MLFIIAVLVVANTSSHFESQAAMTDLWQWFHDNAQPITAIGVIAAMFVSLFAYFSQKQHGKYQRLIEVYKLINNVEEREARKNIYSAFRVYMENYRRNKAFGKVHNVIDLAQFRYADKVLLDIFRDPDVLVKMGMKESDLQKDVERVRATFDHIGALFDSKLIPEDPLLKALWGTGRVCWICLAQNIYIERDKRGTEFYMNNFRFFFDKIERYRVNHRPPLPPVEPS